MTTRPILKYHHSPGYFPPASAALPFIRPPTTPHVHFPPTPALTSTHTTHSPFIYDRAPIVVSPNICALPERGGRMYSPQTSPIPSLHTIPNGSYFDPRAFDACEQEVLDERFAPFSTPPLIPDLSSSSSSEASDDPEAYNYPPALSSIPTIAISPSQDFTYPLLHSHSPDELNAALCFLPHPPPPGKGRRKPKKHGMGDCFQSVNSELAIDGCLGGF
jgi:hypothetical protein